MTKLNYLSRQMFALSDTSHSLFPKGVTTASSHSSSYFRVLYRIVVFLIIQKSQKNICDVVLFLVILVLFTVLHYFIFLTTVLLIFRI